MKPDAFSLLEKAEDSLSAARMLLENGYPEFSASRAYYSMFYVAEALLGSLGLSFSSHGGAIAAFGKEFAKTGKLDPKFHRWLISGQQIRNLGDYSVGLPVPYDKASEMIRQAEEFIGVGKRYMQHGE